MKKNALVITLVCLFSGAIMVGCGNSETTNTATAPTTQPAAAPAAPATAPATGSVAAPAPSNSPDSNQGMVQLNPGEGSFK